MRLSFPDADLKPAAFCELFDLLPERALQLLVVFDPVGDELQHSVHAFLVSVLSMVQCGNEGESAELLKFRVYLHQEILPARKGADNISAKPTAINSHQNSDEVDMKDWKVVQIARVCHEANRAYCTALGDMSQQSWDFAPQWQRDSAIKGVHFCLDNPSAPPSANHESWLEEKRATGWKYGPTKDETIKEHPCFVPYEALPVAQRLKDALFKNICLALG